MTIPRTALVAVLVAPLIAASGLAAELRSPLAELVSTAEDTYAFVRCAGLFESLKEWSGTNVLGPQRTAKFNSDISNLMNAAVVIRMGKSGGTFDQQSTNTARDTSDISDLYIARMKANYASSGQAFGADKLITGDLALCTALVEGR